MTVSPDLLPTQAQTPDAAGGSSRSDVPSGSPHRRALNQMSYAEGAAYLSPDPVQLKPADGGPAKDDTKTKKPSYSDTATDVLTKQNADDDYKLEDLCYMDTHNRMVTIMREYRGQLEALETPDTDGSRAAEIARLDRMIGYLEFAQKIVGTKNRNDDVTKTEAIQAAFPDLPVKEATTKAYFLYQLASTQTKRLGNSSGPMRGAGVGGALAEMGGAELVYKDEIAAGKLKPGAPVQYWNENTEWDDDKVKTVNTGREVYQALAANNPDKVEYVSGHSITFVKYDPTNTNVFYYTDYGGAYGGELSSVDLSSDPRYFIGANISTGGEATNAAEYVLRNTRFQCDKGKQLLEAKAKKYNLDAGKLGKALAAGIASSGHADLATIQASVKHHGVSSAFDHDLVRLVGLWQYAVGIACDGDFGNGSCAKLTGEPLAKATSIQVDASVGQVKPDATEEDPIKVATSAD